MSKSKRRPTNDLAPASELTMTKNTGHKFPPGHQRWGGRRKRTAAEARAMAEEIGVDPLEYMLNLLTRNVVDEIEIDADGNERRVKVPISHLLKIDICKTLANYFYPRLTATQVSGGDKPVAVDSLDFTQLMRDPAAFAAAQTLAIAMATQGQEPKQPSGALVPRDPLATLEKDHSGHWKNPA